VVFVSWRISSLSALCAATFAPVLAWWLLPEVSFKVAVILMATLLLWRHQDNIRRLLSGQENALGKPYEGD